MKLRTVHILNTWLLPRILSLSSITCLVLHFSGCFYSFLMPLFDGRGCNLLATGASQHRLALMKAWIEFMVPDSGSEQRINWPCPSKLAKTVEMKPKLPNLNCLSWQTSLLALPPVCHSSLISYHLAHIYNMSHRPSLGCLWAFRFSTPESSLQRELF